MIVAFGNPVYDEIHTPWVSTRGRVLSGCATNAALIMARLGAEVVVCGRVGSDFESDYNSWLCRDGIVPVNEPTDETGGFRLDYDDRGHRDLTVLGVAEPIQQISSHLERARMVFIGPVLQETPFELIRTIRARTDAPMVLDPQGLLRRIGADDKIEHYKPDGIEEICALFDIVKPNELETEILTGIDPRRDLEGAASVLKGWGISVVVITLAEEGSYIVTDEGAHRVSAIPTVAVDSTGAGDSFAGGLMYARTNGMDWPQAARWATACSTTMIRHCGPGFTMTRQSVASLADKVEVLSQPEVAVPGS